MSVLEECHNPLFVEEAAGEEGGGFLLIIAMERDSFASDDAIHNLK